MVEPRTPVSGAFAVDSPCPDCGNKSILGYLLLNENGRHKHTRYICTFWGSGNPVRCGWHDWVIPKPDPVEVSWEAWKRLDEALSSDRPWVIETNNIGRFAESLEPVLEIARAALALADEVRGHNEHL